MLVSKPDLQKHDEPAPELAGHMLAGYVQLTCALQAESSGTLGTCPCSSASTDQALPCHLHTAPHHGLTATAPVPSFTEKGG